MSPLQPSAPSRFLLTLFATSLALGAAAPVAVFGDTLVVHRGESIQEAVDAAEPGDIILVGPGLYRGVPGEEAVVTVSKSGITLRASRWAVIDASGFEYGIMVGQNADLGPEGCPPTTVSEFRIEGFTIRDAEDTGLRLTGVDGYEILDGRYLNNREYGPFPVCSKNGHIAGNFASGHNDAAIYVGDDDEVLVELNVVTRSAIGIEIENSTNAVVRDNTIIQNTAGILVVVLPGLPMPFTDNVLIEGNLVSGNNLPNPIPLGEPSPVALLPAGTGILNVGGDRVVVRNNRILDNGSVGLALVGNFFAALDPRIEPFIDGNEVRDNVILSNGHNPDPERALTPGVDIVFFPDLLDPDTGLPGVFDPDPSDNCFFGNQFVTQFPPLVTAFFPCP